MKVLALLLPFLLITPLGAQESKELQEILGRWEANSNQFTTLRFEAHRWVYDPEFDMELRVALDVQIRRPGQLSLNLHPSEALPSTSRKLKSNGQPYQVIAAPDAGNIWICGKSRVCLIDPRLKEIEMHDRQPLDGRQPSSPGSLMDFFDTCFRNPPQPILDFFPGGTPDGKRYQYSILKQDQQTIMLSAKPTTSSDQQHLSSAVIILSRATYHPLAVRLLDPLAKKETVYTFSRIRAADDLPDDLMSLLDWEQYQGYRVTDDSARPSTTTKP